MEAKNEENKCSAWKRPLVLLHYEMRLDYSLRFAKLNQALPFIYWTYVEVHMDTIPEDRSHLRGTGPSSYGTGPILFNKIGPVPNWTFS